MKRLLIAFALACFVTGTIEDDQVLIADNTQGFLQELARLNTPIATPSIEGVTSTTSHPGTDSGTVTAAIGDEKPQTIGIVSDPRAQALASAKLQAQPILNAGPSVLNPMGLNAFTPLTTTTILQPTVYGLNSNIPAGIPMNNYYYAMNNQQVPLNSAYTPSYQDKLTQSRNAIQVMQDNQGRSNFLSASGLTVPQSQMINNINAYSLIRQNPYNQLQPQYGIPMPYYG